MYKPLRKPVVGPSPSFIEKYESGDLGSISRRPTALKSVAEESDASSEVERIFAPPADWTPEQVEDFFDAMAPIKDQLVPEKGWWVLEVWPVKVC